VNIEGVIAIDFATFLFAFMTLLVVKFPQIKSSELDTEKINSFLKDATYGWNYITARPGLLVMVVFFAITNFSIGIAQVLFPPMVLNFADAQTLGKIMSIGGSGMLVGSIFMSLWGGFKRQINGVLIFEILLGLGILLAGIKPNPLLVTAGAFIFFFCVPIIIGSSNAIWHTKVHPEVQGRVFATRGMICWSSFPLAFLVAGPMADHIFNPLLAPGGLMTETIGLFVGSGFGRGIGLLFVLLGAAIILITLIASNYPRLRLVEDELPDAVSQQEFSKTE
ncbi:MAG: MFS transporter, partial [Cyanobacteria bacterium P01_D01_bin.116]